MCTQLEGSFPIRTAQPHKPNNSIAQPSTANTQQKQRHTPLHQFSIATTHHQPISFSLHTNLRLIHNTVATQNNAGEEINPETASRQAGKQARQKGGVQPSLAAPCLGIVSQPFLSLDYHLYYFYYYYLHIYSRHTTMTNSHSQFPPSQIRRQPQMQTVGLSHPYFGQGLQLQHPTTAADSPAAAAAAASSISSSTIQRPRSAAPSRNVSSASLSTMQRGIIAAAKDREREYFLPEYLEGTAYGVWVSNWKNHLSTNPLSSLSFASSNGTTTNGSTAMSATAMRREASTPHTVPNSRNPSPHNHAHLVGHRGVAFDITERSSYSTSSTTSSSSQNEPPLLPSRFNERDRCPVLELLNDGMDAKFAGPAKGTDQDAASVRADHPIPSSCGIYYYEVTIMSRGNQGSPPPLPLSLDVHLLLDSSVWDSVEHP